MNKTKTIRYDDLLGGNFRYFGRGKNNEWDCWGLALEICKRANIILPPYKTFIDVNLRHNQIEQGKLDFIKLEKPEPYCLVTFKLYLNFVTHVGVVLEDTTKFIHVLKGRKVCVEKLNKLLWTKKLDSFYKYVGENK